MLTDIFSTFYYCAFQVSPDIMYNGLPWPEEEFIKVKIPPKSFEKIQYLSSR